MLASPLTGLSRVYSLQSLDVSKNQISEVNLFNRGFLFSVSILKIEFYPPLVQFKVLTDCIDSQKFRRTLEKTFRFVFQRVKSLDAPVLPDSPDDCLRY